mgnify:CR=1 FL=1
MTVVSCRQQRLRVARVEVDRGRTVTVIAYRLSEFPE